MSFGHSPYGTHIPEQYMSIFTTALEKERAKWDEEKRELEERVRMAEKKAEEWERFYDKLVGIAVETEIKLKAAEKRLHNDTT